jgi:hypothetical protein
MTETHRKRPVRPRLLGSLQLDFHHNSFCIPDAHGRCSTCSDEALTAIVQQVNEEMCTAIVEIGDQTSEVDISLVEGIYIGQTLLVHGGVAIGTQNPERSG